VTAITDGPYVRLDANPESGIAPLEIALTVNGSFFPDNPAIDAAGPAAVETLTSTDPDEYRYRLPLDGLYYFTLTAVGPDASQLQDDTAVIAFNQASLESYLRTMWTAMTDKLSIADTEGALAYLSPATREDYRQMADALLVQLPDIVDTQVEFNFLYAVGNIAKFELVESDNGQLRSHEVTFAKDENGIWKIVQF